MAKGNPLSRETAAAIYHERNTPCLCCRRIPSLKEIAYRYNVSISTVSNIANTKSRKP